MDFLKKSIVEAPDTLDGDPRIGHMLGTAVNEKDRPKAVLVGFPSDEGVKRNGGRVGAAQAPDAIRKQFYKLTPDAENPKPFSKLINQLDDVGNIRLEHDLDKNQQRMGQVLAGFLEQGIIPIILGGGHETAFGHFLGYAEAGIKTAIFNLDAHADVRSLKKEQSHSGSPFRQAIEHSSATAEKYLVAGLQPHSVASSHLAYIDQKKGHYLFRDETNITSISGLFHRHESDRLMVTFDMDAVDQSFAPGVSAPCTNGLSSELWLMAAYLAGKNEQVTSFDLSEVNPEYDCDGQTARLAALTIWHFLLGLSQR